VAADEDGKGGFIAMSDESVEQPLIVVFITLLRSQLAAKAANTGGECGRMHECGSGGGNKSHLLIVAARREFDNKISPPIQGYEPEA
jgi:hypothetical protein